MKNKKILLFLGGLGLYLMSTGVSYAVFNYLKTPPKIEMESPLSEEKKGTVVVSGPKTEVCPLNGAKYTQQEKEIWQKRRPLAVMIENHLDCRPQSGLSKADIVYEAVAEGGITRFMAIYYCDAAAFDTLLGPIRSARTYFLDWALEYDPAYVHVGGAACDSTVDSRAQALCQIKKYEMKDIDQMGRYGSYPYFWRDYEKLGRPVATEHTMHSTTEKLWEVAQKAGYGPEDEEGIKWIDNFRPWHFKQEAKKKGNISQITVNFWEGHDDYQVVWQYDSQKNEYQRSNGGQPHLDFNTKQPLTAKVIIIQKEKEIGPVDEHKHLLYKTIGSGQALIFQDGQVIKGKWVKKDRFSRTTFYNQKGQEIQFNRGRIWIEIVPARSKIQY